jgi:putative flippase GtrA
MSAARRRGFVFRKTAYLRSPESGLFGQGTRFAAAGSSVTLVYIAVTTLLADVVGLPFQLALITGFCLAIVLHFTLQRAFVWTHREEFALRLRAQVTRYLAVAAAQYGVTAASTSLLPPLLGVSTELVYLPTVALVVSTNFLVFRQGIFHARAAGRAPNTANTDRAADG